MAKKRDKNLSILRTKRAFKLNKKAFVIILKGLSLVKNCLRPESAPLNMFRNKKNVVSISSLGNKNKMNEKNHVYLNLIEQSLTTC